MARTKSDSSSPWSQRLSWLTSTFNEVVENREEIVSTVRQSAIAGIKVAKAAKDAALEAWNEAAETESAHSAQEKAPQTGKSEPSPQTMGATSGLERTLGVLKQGRAVRVIFFYQGEEGTYLDHPYVTLYRNGIVHVELQGEEVTTDLKNVEIQWTPPQDGSTVRVVKFAPVNKTEK